MASRHVTRAVAIFASAGMVAAGSRSPMAERPPAGFTGGFGEETCVSCHTGNDINAFGGSVSLEGLPETYEAGREYVLTVRLEADETVTAGFQMAARFSEGDPANAGEFSPLTNRVATTDSAGVMYVHHGPDGVRTEDDTGASWQVAWRAPVEGGAVAFHVAANSGNGDDSPLGDLVFSHRHVVAPEVYSSGHPEPRVRGSEPSRADSVHR